MRVRTCVRVLVRACVRVRVRMRVRMRVRVRVRVRVWLCVRVHVCVCVRARLRVCKCVCVFTSYLARGRVVWHREGQSVLDPACNYFAKSRNI